MNYCIKHSMLCELSNAYGSCQTTICSKYLNFPQTIGDITFNNSKELIKWVEDKQRINEDPDYGLAIGVEVKYEIYKRIFM